MTRSSCSAETSGPICVSGSSAVADLQRLGVVGHALDELLVDRLLDEQPRAGAADLAGVGEHRHAGARHRRVQIGVGEDDVGRLAAELQRHALEVAGDGLDDLLAGQVRAGERHLVHARVRRQRRAGGLAEAGHDVDHAGRHARLQAQLAQPQRRQRRLLRRLEHDGAAGGERRADLPDRRG